MMKSYVSTHCHPRSHRPFSALSGNSHSHSLSLALMFFFSLQLTLPLMHTFPHRCVPARSPTATRCTAPYLCAACILAISRSWADVLARISPSLSGATLALPLSPSLATQGVGTYTRSIKAVEKELTTHLAKVYTSLSLPTQLNHPHSSVHPHAGPRTKSIRSAGLVLVPSLPPHGLTIHIYCRHTAQRHRLRLRHPPSMHARLPPPSLLAQLSSPLALAGRLPASCVGGCAAVHTGAPTGADVVWAIRSLGQRAEWDQRVGHRAGTPGSVGPCGR